MYEWNISNNLTEKLKVFVTRFRYIYIHFQTEKYQENKRSNFQIIDPMNCHYDSKNRGKIEEK